MELSESIIPAVYSVVFIAMSTYSDADVIIENLVGDSYSLHKGNCPVGMHA